MTLTLLHHTASGPPLLGLPRAKPAPGHGATLQGLAADVERALGRRLPPGERPFAAATRRLARGVPTLEAYGFAGAVPAAPPAPPLALPPLPPRLEAVAFRAGRKPVAFLTVRPSEVDATLAAFPGAHAERHDRRVAVAALDTWTDRRDEGEPRVELYLSRDPALARRAAALQTADPSAAARELGALLGYPRCCADAFAGEDARANNTRNRYAVAARTGPGPWPWELADHAVALSPFFPCSYRCEAAVAWVREVLAALEQERPGAIAQLRAALARPVLYLGHDAWLSFEGEAHGARVVHRGACATPSLAALGGACGDGALELSDAALVVDAGARFVLERADPGLGLVLPFA